MHDIERRAFMKAAGMGALAFPIGGAEVLLTPGAARAQTVPFEDTPFKARNATVPRPLKDHIGDVLNVKSFGAMGNKAHNDTANIQACFDTAFGGPKDAAGASAPHGVANAWKNRAVFFPPGIYRTTAALTLTDLYGALIFGSGIQSTQIITSPTTSGIVTDGMSNCCIRDMTITPPEGPRRTGIGLDLDWNGTTGGATPAGLGNNLFYNFSSGNLIGLRIAHGGHKGAANSFIRGGFGGIGTGGAAILVEGSEATGQLFQGGGYGGPTVIKVTGGSVHVQSVAFVNDNGDLAFDISSSAPCTIVGCRTEQKLSQKFFKLTGARVYMCTVNSSEVATPMTVMGDMSSSASLVMDAVSCAGAITATSGCKIYARGSNLPNVNFASLGTIIKQNI